MKGLLYRIYQIIVLFPVVVVMTIWAGSTAAIMCPLVGWFNIIVPGIVKCGRIFRADWWGTFASRIWGKIIIAASLLPVEVKGRENIEKDTSYVFVANHQGAYDIFLVCGYLGAEIRWMLKRSLEKVPFLGVACRHAGYVFVDKGNPGKVRSTYRHAEKVLQGGASLMVFPEGSRTRTGKMTRFRRGAFALADELQLPVVPMTINGSYDVLPASSDGGFIHYHKLSLTIHKPLYPESRGDENLQRMLNESYDMIHSGLEG